MRPIVRWIVASRRPRAGVTGGLHFDRRESAGKVGPSRGGGLSLSRGGNAPNMIDAHERDDETWRRRNAIRERSDLLLASCLVLLRRGRVVTVTINVH